jgi:hypothetical protein
MNGILLQHGYLIAQIKADEDTRAVLQNTSVDNKENKEDLTVVANIEKKV